MHTTVRSFSKINLGLAVGPPRADGFHALTTVYQTLALHDLVHVHAEVSARTRITLEADHGAVPTTARGDAERNTAYKIVAHALERMRISADVHLRIEKRLPVQGGLGAGSANAVAALLGLERELGEALPGAERLALAAEVGSDVPLFLIGGTVLGVNRGEAVFPLPEAAPLQVVVAIPPVGVSTAQAFRDLDRRSASGDSLTPGLTSPSSSDRLAGLSRVIASVWTHTGAGRAPTGIASSTSVRPSVDEVPSQGLGTGGDLAGSSGAPASLFAGVKNPLLALVHTGVENDFEEVAFRQHPSLREIKRALAGNPETPGSRALYTALSGSGSALFGIYGDAVAAREAQQRVEFLGVKALLTETLDRQGYWEQMFA